MSSKQRGPCSIAEPEAGQRDRDLVRLYWPVALRPAFDVLLGIDDAMGRVVATSTQPALGAIRLAWWRDALNRLDQAPPPAEPMLKTAAEELLPRGVSGAALGRIAEGWGALFDEVHDLAAIAARGVSLFAAGAILLGAEDARLAVAGRYFALADVTRRRLAPLPGVPVERLRFARSLRPLTALACLAARDLVHGEPFEPEATPGRALALMAHRWTGRIS